MQPVRRVIARFCPIPCRRWHRHFCLMVIPQPSLASVMRYRYGRRALWGPSTHGPQAAADLIYFYGFIGGEANQWYPTLYAGTTPVDPKKTPEEGYHLMEDMTEKAIAWVGQQKALARTNRSSPTLPRVQPMHPITYQRSGPTSTRESLMRAGINFVKRHSHARNLWVSSLLNAN